VKNTVFEAWDTLGAAGAAVSVAKTSVIATSFFTPTGWLAAIGIGTAVTPIGWVVAAGVVTGGAWLGVTRYLKNNTESRVTVIPDFINTPLDALALGLFDLMAPLALKVADIDGDIHKSERELIEAYFIKQWGYDPNFVREGMAYTESNLSNFSIEVVARALAEYKKENPDCNFQVMTKEMLRFLNEIIEADNKIDEREKMVIQYIESIIREVGELSLQKKAKEGWGFLKEKVGGSIPIKSSKNELE